VLAHTPSPQLCDRVIVSLSSYNGSATSSLSSSSFDRIGVILTSAAGSHYGAVQISSVVPWVLETVTVLLSWRSGPERSARSHAMSLGASVLEHRVCAVNPH